MTMPTPMFIVIRKTASIGHNFGGDEYRIHSAVAFETLDQATEAYFDWCEQPPGPFGYNDAQILQEGREMCAALHKEIMLSKRRVKARREAAAV